MLSGFFLSTDNNGAESHKLELLLICETSLYCHLHKKREGVAINKRIDTKRGNNQENVPKNERQKVQVTECVEYDTGVPSQKKKNGENS